MATQTFQPDETAAVDCYVISQAATTAYNDTKIKVGTESDRGALKTGRGLLRFDLTTLPSDAYITDVALTLTRDSTSGLANQTAKVFRTINSDWDETASWTYQTGTTNWVDGLGGPQTFPTYSTHPASVAFTLNPSSTTYTIDGSDMVLLAQDAIDFRSSLLSIALVSDNEATTTQIVFNSSADSTVADRPKLVITYETATVNVWDGSAGDGNLSTASNWSTGVVPDQYDTVHFSEPSSGAVTSGSLTCDRLRIGNTYGDDIGTSSTSITMTCETAAIERTNGYTNINFGATAASVFVTRIPRANNFTVLGGTITNLFVSESRAYLKIADSSTITNVYLAPSDSRGVYVEFGTGINCNVTAQRSAMIKSASGLNNITLTGGATLEMSAAAGDTASGIVTISRSKLNHNGVTTAGGALNLYSGLYSVADSTVAQHTIASVNQYGGVLDTRNGIQSFNGSTVTGAWLYLGGTIHVDPGSTLDVS